MKPIALFIAIYVAVVLPLKAAGTCVYSIPPCPPGLTLKVYAFNPLIKKIKSALPVVKGCRDVFDAKPYFISNGIHFPRGGFAFYFKNNNFMIVVTDRKNQDLTEVFLD